MIDDKVKEKSVNPNKSTKVDTYVYKDTLQ